MKRMRSIRCGAAGYVYAGCVLTLFLMLMAFRGSAAAAVSGVSGAAGEAVPGGASCDASGDVLQSESADVSGNTAGSASADASADASGTASGDTSEQTPDEAQTEQPQESGTWSSDEAQAESAEDVGAEQQEESTADTGAEQQEESAEDTGTEQQAESEDDQMYEETTETAVTEDEILTDEALLEEDRQEDETEGAESSGTAIISIRYDNNDVHNGSYFNAARVLTITFSGDGFTERDLCFTIRAGEKYGTGVSFSDLSEYGISGWKQVSEVTEFMDPNPLTGRYVTYTLYFGADNTYEMIPCITAEDVSYKMYLESGTAAPYAFTIDTQAPEIMITGAENEMSYSGAVQPYITVSDRNCLTDSLTLTVEGIEHEKETAEGVWREEEDGSYSAQLDDFAYTKDADDIYTICVTAEDAAGNRTEKEICFSVNRYGSNFVLSGEAQQMVDAVYVNTVSDVVIYEYNVSPVADRVITCTCENVQMELTEGMDYTITEGETGSKWLQYVYRIGAELFEKEGRYVITVSTTDAASNRMTNRMKDCEITFVVDRTAPTIVVTGLEAGTYYEDRRDYTITYYDSIPVVLLRIYEGSDLIAEYADERIEEKGGIISSYVQSRTEEQTVIVTAQDAAGNVSTEHVTVSVLGSRSSAIGGLFSGNGLFSGGGLFSDEDGETDGGTGSGKYSLLLWAVVGAAAVCAAGILMLLPSHLKRRRLRR